MNKPLAEKKIVVTRSESDSKLSAAYFLKAGAEVIVFPVICVNPCNDFSEFDKIIKSDPDYIIFTSGNAVRVFSERIESINYIPDYSKITVASVGNKTSDLCRHYGIRSTICPDEFSASGLLKEFEKYEITNKKILIPTSALARDELAEGLKARGAIIYRINIYDITLPPQNMFKKQKELLKTNKADAYIFASPSAFNNFLKIMDIDDASAYFIDTCVAAIGPVTQNAIIQSGTEVSVMPSEYTMEAVSEEIIKYFNR